ncbi:MAG: hypothetical protein M3Z80_09385 [Apibacter sp.]|uniref:hypothetical protein n=1 Tax=Apibacter sp. TaxID=2023709 RepID=UPI0025F1399A|nr:hypothetical protein [Apibacter sp.]MCT6870142.1 hypothetical protein [Apibacter sp.]
MRFSKIFLLIFLLQATFIVTYAQDNTIKPEEITEKQINDLDKDVNLDDFQKLELHEFILEKITKVKNAIDTGISDTELRFLMENNNREIDFKLKEILSPEQFEKYLELKRERAINIDHKKKKRKKTVN